MTRTHRATAAKRGNATDPVRAAASGSAGTTASGPVEPAPAAHAIALDRFAPERHPASRFVARPGESANPDHAQDDVPGDGSEPQPAGTSAATNVPGNLALAQPRGMSAELAHHASRARAYIEAARSPATRRAYAADWAQFADWCAHHALSALPATPATAILFVTAMKDGDPAADPPRAPKRLSTLSRYLSAINDRHKEAGHLPPGEQDGGHYLRRAFAGIRNTHGTRPEQKQAADGERLGRMLSAITGDDVRSLRDRALLAIGMAAALRRSELVALTFTDVHFVPEGLRLFVARSKTDQAGRGAWIAIPEGRRIRPKALLLEWLRVSRVTDGPIFRKLAEVRVARRDADGAVIRDADGRPLREWREDRVQPAALSAQGVALVVKARARDAGLDPALFAGHSLRSGFLTEAARQPGANIFKMREVSRHKSLDILAAYVREHDGFRDHAGDRFL